MFIYPNEYYHLYNRSNNNEIVFKSLENYYFFLKKCRKYLLDLIDIIGYCLMPTHFHFLIFIKSDKTNLIRSRIGIWLSSYTKAVNKQNKRNGSLFQHHTKAKHINDDEYLITLLTYIHQNPLRSGLSNKTEDWEFSSYRDYIKLRNGKLPRKDLINGMYSIEELRSFTDSPIQEIRSEYWV